ncbi:MAG: sensor domain-containing protein [Gammaproteobacteria bacterium]
MVDRQTIHLLELVSTPFVIVEPNGTIVWANSSMAHLLGFNNKELSGKTLASLSAKGEQAALKLLRLFSGSGNWLVGSLTLHTRDGGEIDFPCEGAVFRPYGSKRPALISIRFNQRLQFQSLTRKIDELNGEIRRRKLVETALRASELKYRVLAERSPLAIQVFAPDGTPLRVNAAWEELWQTPFSALQHYNLFEDRQLEALHILPLIKKAFAGESVELPEHEYDKAKTPNISHHHGKLWLRVFAYPVLDDNGKLLEVVVIQQDVTKHKQAEIKLQLAAKVFTHAREGIMITDVNANIVEVNDTFTAITGYSRAEALGKNPRMLQSGRHESAFYAAMWKSILEKGHWYGEIWDRRKDGQIYAALTTISAVRDTADNIQNFLALFSDITPIKEHQLQLEHIAHYDALTGLPNRVLLADRLKQAMHQSERRGLSLAVAYLDLDGFKAVNDSYGHPVGDRLLITLAQRMKDVLRDGDSLARIGGDEFIAVLVDLQQTVRYETILQRLLEAVSAPVTLENIVVNVSASLGVTFFPDDNVDAEQLIRHADYAMYIAKQAGKNRYHLFDVEEDAALQNQHLYVEQVRKGFERGEFELFYQPKVNMKTGKIAGVEALIRWQHPVRGQLPPGEFLPLFGDHPIAIEIGEWVIDAALTQIAQWRETGIELTVSVNIGATQLQQHDFLDRLKTLLAAHGNIPPDRLDLEILETSALQDITFVSKLIRDCKVIGVRFTLDDFGTGYSSLTYLRHLPADALKIDQSFVRDMLDDPDDLAIVQGVIGLAKAFGREVIAEGVETVAHRDILLQLGCELGQGYGIGRPMPAWELPQWILAWKQRVEDW